jgi:hypothetical protein
VIPHKLFHRSPGKYHVLQRHIDRVAQSFERDEVLSSQGADKLVHVQGRRGILVELVELVLEKQQLLV